MSDEHPYAFLATDGVWHYTRTFSPALPCLAICGLLITETLPVGPNDRNPDCKRCGRYVERWRSQRGWDLT